MEKKYYLFRHGVTVGTKNDGWYGYNLKFITADILPECIDSINKMGLYLKDQNTDLHLTSPVMRCQQTSDIVSQITNKPFIKHSLLVDRYPWGIPSYKYRMNKLYQELTSLEHQAIVICTHGDIIQSLASLLTTSQLNNNLIRNFPPPGVLVSIKDRQVNYLDFN